MLATATRPTMTSRSSGAPPTRSCWATKPSRSSATPRSRGVAPISPCFEKRRESCARKNAQWASERKFAVSLRADNLLASRGEANRQPYAVRRAPLSPRDDARSPLTRLPRAAATDALTERELHPKERLMKRSAHDCTTTPAMRRRRTRRSQRGEVYFETL